MSGAIEGLFGGEKTTTPPSRDDSEAREQQRRRKIAQGNQRSRQKTILGDPLGSASAAPQRKTALGG